MSPALLPILKILGGFVLLVLGGEFLVRSSSQLARAMKISPLVIGLTVVAFGTSAPELAVSIQAAFSGNADVAIGNVVGSNIFNVLFILGTSALIVPLVVSKSLVRRDVPLMILASVLLLVLGWDGNLNRVEGGILFAGIVIYTAWCIWQSRRQHKIVLEMAAEQDSPEKLELRSLVIQGLILIGGLILLGLGASWLIDGTVWCAKQLGISELVIGLTVVAIGTSLPEVVTSLVAAWRGERDIAVGNVVGSNMFNILCVLGATGLCAPHGVAVASTALRFDIPIMIAVAVVCLPIFATSHTIRRWEGAMFLFYYFLYTTLVVLDATGQPFVDTLRKITVYGIIPLTVLALTISVYRSVQNIEVTDIEEQSDQIVDE